MPITMNGFQITEKLEVIRKVEERELEKKGKEMMPSREENHVTKIDKDRKNEIQKQNSCELDVVLNITLLIIEMLQKYLNFYVILILVLRLANK